MSYISWCSAFFPNGLSISKLAGARKELGLLFYLHQDESSAVVQMQSKDEPTALLDAFNKEYHPNNAKEQKQHNSIRYHVLEFTPCDNEDAMKEVNPNMPFNNHHEDWVEPGNILKIQTMAMPASSVKIGTKRIRHYMNAENAGNWFTKQMKECADVAEEMYCIPDPNSYTKKGVYLKHRPYVISTWVKIKNKEEFEKVLAQGIGKERTFGRGMIRILDQCQNAKSRFAS